MKQIFKRIFNLRGDLGSLFGNPTKNDPYNNIQTPNFQPDSSYTNASQQLATLGQNILSGNLPSFYSSLGKANSPQFQALEANTIGQTNNASAQQAAASGTDRSGVAATAAAGNLANVLPSMQYSDYLNAQQQQAGLLNMGTGITENVGAMGLTNQAQTNGFAQNKFNEQMDLTQATNQWNQQAAAAQGMAQGNALSALFGQNVGSIFTGTNPNTSNMGSNNSSNNNQYGMAGQFSSFLSSLGSSGNTGNLSANTSSFGGGTSPLSYSPSQIASMSNLVLSGV